MSNQKLYLIGGPNGAGKTTFAKEYLPNELNCLRFLNSDEIASGLSPFSPAAAQVQAARILIKNLKNSLKRKETFALESTLSGKSYAQHLEKAKENGFEIIIHFLWLPNVEESILRVENRFKEGGHDVPLHALKRRFPRVIDNFRNVYAPLADEWHIWDASSYPSEYIGNSKDIHLNLIESL